MLYLDTPDAETINSDLTVVLPDGEVVSNNAPECYVGLDPSITNTGLVVLDSQGNLLEAVDCKKAYTKKPYASDIQKYLASANFICGILQKYHIRCISYENYSFNSVHRGYSLAEYGGILKAMLLQQLGITVQLVAPATNKKFAAGNGFAKKEFIVEAAKAECSKLGSKPSNDICDAYFLAKFGFYLHNTDVAVKVDFGNDNLRTRLEIIKKYI